MEPPYQRSDSFFILCHSSSCSSFSLCNQRLVHFCFVINIIKHPARLTLQGERERLIVPDVAGSDDDTDLFYESLKLRIRYQLCRSLVYFDIGVDDKVTEALMRDVITLEDQYVNSKSMKYWLDGSYFESYKLKNVSISTKQGSHALANIINTV